LDAAQAKKLDLQLLAIAAQLRSQDIALPLKELLVGELDFQLFQLLLGLHDVLTLVDLSEKLLVEEAADFLWVFLIFYSRAVGLRDIVGGELISL
jgi:hypothetical protein